MIPEQPWTNLNCNGKIKVCTNCLLSEQLFLHRVGGCDFQLNREREKNSFIFGLVRFYLRNEPNWLWPLFLNVNCLLYAVVPGSFEMTVFKIIHKHLACLRLGTKYKKMFLIFSRNKWINKQSVNLHVRRGENCQIGGFDLCNSNIFWTKNANYNH
jgi:hypothetical protein